MSEETNLKTKPLTRVSSSENQEIFVLPRQKSRSRDRRDSRMFLVDGQLCWSDEHPSGLSGKRSSSVGLMFGSSMDLSGIGQSLDSSGGAGSGNEEAISYRIKWCRENIVQLKRQTWPMDKKLQVLRASKMFIKQHQGELKQSKQAKDVIASAGAIFDRYWRHFKREFANLLVIITPWEMRIKKIESHFGSVVASYFTFLRWIFWLNLANSLVMCTFVMVPELIENSADLTGMRKGELGMQQSIMENGLPMPRPEFNPTLSEIWEFEGFLRFSPMFYGYYSNTEISRSGYWRNPLAFLLSAMFTYLLCFFCISRKLSQNTKLSRIGSKDDEYTFCWTVFVGWDFMIGNSETAYNKTSSLIMNLKEGILEEKEQTKDRNWRLIFRRVMANVLTLMLLVLSSYVVYLAVERSEKVPDDANMIQKNELQFVLSGIQFIFPPLFDVIGMIEKYHPRKALSWQLGRILFLDFLNFYTLMFSLFNNVDKYGQDLNYISRNITEMRKNQTYYKNLFKPITSTSTTTTAATFTANLSTLSMAGDNYSSTTTNTVTSSSISDPGLNASTILTTVLLASSTMSIRDLNGTLDSIANNISNGETTTAMYQNTYLPLSTFKAPVVDEPSPTSTIESTNVTTILTSSTKQTSLFSTSEVVVTSTSKEDEDYPDVDELVKVNTKKKLLRLVRSSLKKVKKKRKRRPNEADGERARVDETEREEGQAASKELAFRQDLLATSQLNNHSPRVYLDAFIPPIQDPYRTVGSNQWPVIVGFPDQDQEEPLEGRLELSKPSTSTRLPYRTGLARPFESGGTEIRRPTSNRGRQTNSTVSLYDDTNEDLFEPTETTTLLNSDRLSKPVTQQAFVELTTPLKIYSAKPDLQDPLLRVELSTISLGVQSESSNLTVSMSVKEFKEVTQTDATSNEANMTTTQPSTGCTSVVDSTSWFFNDSVGQLNKSAYNVSAELKYTDCSEIPDIKHQEIVALNRTLKDKLASLCWETMFGQEMVKTVVMDLVMTVLTAVSFEFMRACFVRYCNRFFFWDLERGMPGYQDFKLAENVLHLVNNQSTVWMGMFFAPGLPAINTVKLAVLMYVRSWVVLTCNIPHETVFKVSKSNNFYYWILLINLLICILPVAYAVTWIRPSWHCGPFGGECRMYLVMTKLVKSLLPPEANSVLRYLTSPGAIIPILISLILIIYYLASTVSSSKEANKELKAQLKKDKEQEAAVPKITNTVEPATPVTPATSAAPAPAAVPPAASLTAALFPSNNLNNLTVQDKTLNNTAKSESRPKTLLMPPSI